MDSGIEPESWQPPRYSVVSCLPMLPSCEGMLPEILTIHKSPQKTINEAKSNLIRFYSTREFNWIYTLLVGRTFSTSHCGMGGVGGPYKSPHLRRKKSRPGNVPLI
jgi:hypothetical protein